MIVLQLISAASCAPQDGDGKSLLSAILLLRAIFGELIPHLFLPLIGSGIFP